MCKNNEKLINFKKSSIFQDQVQYGNHFRPQCRHLLFFIKFRQTSARGQSHTNNANLVATMRTCRPVIHYLVLKFYCFLWVTLKTILLAAYLSRYRLFGTINTAVPFDVSFPLCVLRPYDSFISWFRFPCATSELYSRILKCQCSSRRGRGWSFRACVREILSKYRKVAAV